MEMEIQRQKQQEIHGKHMKTKREIEKRQRKLDSHRESKSLC